MQTILQRARVFRWTALAAFLASLAAVAVASSAGPGHKLGMWDVFTAMQFIPISGQMANWATGAAFAALLIVFALPRPGLAFRMQAVAAVVLVMGLQLFFVFLQEQSKAFPPLNDVTTNIDDVPVFAALDVAPPGSKPMPDFGRAELVNLADYDRWVHCHEKSYPDLKTRIVRVPQEEVAERALQAATALGWTIVRADPDAGRIEAIAASSWIGFQDDVVIRIRTAGADRSAVDVRSVSRIQIPNVGDSGENYRRIMRFLERLDELTTA